MATIEQLTGPIAAHGEGPVWSPQWGGLRWVDTTAGDVLRFGADGAVERWHVGPMVSAIRPRTDSGMVMALERGFALSGDWGSDVELLGEVWADPHVRFNDGGCDPDGNFLCGSMGDDFGPGRGTMYRLNADRTVTTLFGDLGVSNGLAWTADGATAYFADTLAGTIDRFDYDSERGLHNRRPFVDVPTEQGMPDGLALDVEGYVWTALWNGGAVRRYAPDGRLDTVLEFPVQRVTACTFGGAELTDLYVTSIGASPEPHETAAGALFRVAVGVRGLPALAYGG